jgi:hypothetical protein
MTSRWNDRTSGSTCRNPFPAVVERIRGTPARIEDEVRDLPAALLARRAGDAWSIQEHIGYLLDLDALHSGRLDDFLAGAEVLRTADITNRKTWDAHYNDLPLADFRRKRNRFVARLDAWDPDLLSITARHPRLMRVIDMPSSPPTTTTTTSRG